jgi:hypothetical protein
VLDPEWLQKLAFFQNSNSSINIIIYTYIPPINITPEENPQLVHTADSPRALRLSANNQDIIVDVQKLSRSPKEPRCPPTCCWRSLFRAITQPTSSETLSSRTQIVNPRECQWPQHPIQAINVLRLFLGTTTRHIRRI